MWFAALDPRRSAYWLSGLATRLFENAPPVVALLDDNPFPDEPPRSLRFVMYRYTFTDPATRRSTGAWWDRELIGVLGPPLERAERIRSDSG